MKRRFLILPTRYRDEGARHRLRRGRVSLEQKVRSAPSKPMRDKSPVHNLCCILTLLGIFWILDMFGFAFWIHAFGLWTLLLAPLGSRDETGDEIEDPNDSLTMRTPFTGLRPDQNLRQSKSPRIFCSKYFGGFWLVGDFGRNHPTKIWREEEGRITGGSRTLPRGFASKSSWTKIL